MAQVKIYGSGSHIDAPRRQIFDLIHRLPMTTVGLPEDKRFHRSTEAKKHLLNGLIRRFVEDISPAAADVDIAVFETPRANWGTRGRLASDLVLNYKAAV